MEYYFTTAYILKDTYCIYNDKDLESNCVSHYFITKTKNVSSILFCACAARASVGEKRRALARQISEMPQKQLTKGAQSYKIT